MATHYSSEMIFSLQNAFSFLNILETVELVDIISSIYLNCGETIIVIVSPLASFSSLITVAFSLLAQLRN